MNKYRAPEVLDHLKYIDLPVEKSNFFVTDELQTSLITDPDAVFIPRDLEGFIKNVESEREIKNNYIHEAGHGAYFENTENGRRIRQIDSELNSLESRLFNEEFTEEILTLPGNVENSLEVDYNDITFLDIEDDYEKYYLVNKELLEEYRGLREDILKKYNQNLPKIEGFSLLLEEELGEQTQISKYPDSYIKGYNILKPIKEDQGWQAVIQALS
ncbi:MAG: hypothetical protein ACLFRK_01340 [Candidatus Nanohaloarchaea archaeon]